MGNGTQYNFFEHLEKPVMLKPMGFLCKQPYCIADYRKKYHLNPESKFSLEVSDSEYATIDTGILGIDLALTNKEVLNNREIEQNYVEGLKNQ